MVVRGIMFCPKCGAQNPEDTSFCRQCGEDLSLVSKAMAKQLPLVIADKIEGALRRSPTIQLEWLKILRLRAKGELLVGVVSLLALIWFFALGRGNPEFAYGMFTTVACYLIVLGLWDYRKARQLGSSRGEAQAAELSAARTTKELMPPDLSEAVRPPSVTESTTRHLDAAAKRNG
jgi:ribosomal protein L40E